MLKLKGIIFISGVAVLLLLFTGCSSKPQGPLVISQDEVVLVPENDIPGTVRRTWEEPMVDVVDVPGQVDPTNTYYRLPHKTLQRVRPGKVQEVQ